VKHVLLAVTEALEKQQAENEEKIINLRRRIRFLRSIEADEQVIEGLEQVLTNAVQQQFEATRCALVARSHISPS